MIGNVRIGATDTTSFGSKMSMRVMHIRRGLPLISALHDPHLPALQFHRQGGGGGGGGWVGGGWRRHPPPPLDGFLLEAPAARVAAEHPHREGRRHHFRSWKRAFSSGGIWGSGSRRPATPQPCWRGAGVS